jgi:hypothetical protein
MLLRTGHFFRQLALFIEKYYSVFNTTYSTTKPGSGEQWLI